MNLSLFIHQYVDFRLCNSSIVELYIIDQIQNNLFELLIKDDGTELKGDELNSAQEKVKKLELSTRDKNFQYFHKGKNHLQLEIDLSKKKLELSDLNNIIGFLMLQFQNKKLITTYLSPKGEYNLNSRDFVDKFTDEEIQSKEFALYLNELLQDQLSEVIMINS